MGRNIANIEMTVQERQAIAREWTIEDFMEDEENRLKRMLDHGVICRDEYLDGIDHLRETAEDLYRMSFEDTEESYEEAESDWDYLQEYMESF